MSSGKWRPFCLGLNVLNNKAESTLIGASRFVSRIVYVVLWPLEKCLLKKFMGQNYAKKKKAATLYNVSHHEVHSA